MRTVATAGHVDHGKSSLVRALTGTDPDRFAEEKERGLTIDLGFAFTTLPSGVDVGFVDVPGHVRFVKNMLAGVGAVGTALLVVSADDGWMPQSEEHLRILELLGILEGVVAITKADTVDADTLELAQLEVTERLATSPWHRAPVVVCDSVSGRGLEELRRALDDVLAAASDAPDHGRPRLWVDRAFAARGAGTVVTGTLAGGRVTVDDELVVARTGARARVRGVQSGHHPTRVAEPGARVALNLTGVEHRALARGDALVRPGQWVQATTVDVELVVEPEAALPRRARLLAYAGSGEHHVELRLLDDEGRFARVRLPHALALAPGDHLVLRDSGRSRVVAGAMVLDVEPKGRPRDAPARLVLPLGPRLLAAREWLPIADVGRLAGADDMEVSALVSSLVESGAAVRIGDELVTSDALASLRERARQLVHQRHRDHPLDPGLELATLSSEVGLDAARVREALRDVDGLVVERGFVRETGHRAPDAASPEGAALVAALDAAPFAPPDVAATDADPALVRALVRNGTLADVGGIVFTSAAVDQARDLVRAKLRSDGSISVGDARDLLGSSRKYVVPLLERFDSEGVTRRSGDTRVAGPASASSEGQL